MKLPNTENIQNHETAVEFLIVVAAQRLDREQILHRQAPCKESADNIEALEQAIITAEDFLAACSDDFEPFRASVHPLYTKDVEETMERLKAERGD